MNILQAVDAYEKKHGKAKQEGIFVGNATCGQGGCRRKHAKARTTREPPKNPGIDNRPGILHWQLWRPCDRHDSFTVRPGEW